MIRTVVKSWRDFAVSKTPTGLVTPAKKRRFGIEVLARFHSKGWGGFGFYFLGSRATAYAKHPDDKAWLFDVDTMKARINNPACVRAIQAQSTSSAGKRASAARQSAR